MERREGGRDGGGGRKRKDVLGNTYTNVFKKHTVYILVLQLLSFCISVFGKFFKPPVLTLLIDEIPRLVQIFLAVRQSACIVKILHLKSDFPLRAALCQSL